MEAGEYIIAFHCSPEAFLPQHFALTWLDRENGVLAVQGRLKKLDNEYICKAARTVQQASELIETGLNTYAKLKASSFSGRKSRSADIL